MYKTLTEACHAWVERFNRIPMSAVEKIYNCDESIYEITPPAKYDRVYVFNDDWRGEHGEIIETKYDGEDDLYLIRLDSDPKDPKVISRDCFEVEYESVFPMWGWMWSFDDTIDDEWLNGEYLGPHLQEMADCGFRIYESEDFGYIFGIDGCGYDFYESHWCPLYKVRGMYWHEVDDTIKENKNVVGAV